MRRLRLFKDPLDPPIERELPLARNAHCTRCELNRYARTVCMPAAGEPGGLLTVGLYPGPAEDAAGIPNVGDSGRFLHNAIRERWSGPIAHDNAVRCYPGSAGGESVKPDHVDKCRAYGASILREVTPTRILALGEWASYAIFGHKIQTMSARRGFSWIPRGNRGRCSFCDNALILVSGRALCSNGCEDPLLDAPDPVPVLFLFHPAAAVRNRYYRSDFLKDLDWALSTPTEFFVERYYHVMGGECLLIENEEDAHTAVDALRAAPEDTAASITLDVESAGQLYDQDFRLLSLSACRSGDTRAYTWDRKAIGAGLLQELLRLLQDPAQTVVTQSDYDDAALHQLYGAPIAGRRRDTRLLHRLYNPRAAAGLDTLALFVGGMFYWVDLEREMKRVVERMRAWNPKQTDPFDDCPDPAARQAIYEGYRALGSKFSPQKYAYALVPSDTLSIYNACDVVFTGLDHEWIWPQVRADKGLSLVWDEIRDPAARSYHWMGHWGLPVDVGAVRTMMFVAQNQQLDLRRQLERFLSGKFANISFNSVKDVASFLFSSLPEGGLGLPPQKLTEKTAQPSVSEPAIEELEQYLRLALEKQENEAYRVGLQFLDLYARYKDCDGYIEKGDELLRCLRQDGRVHPSYLLDGTETGRACLARGTRIEVLRGVLPRGVPVEEVHVGDLVYCYDDDLQLVRRRVKWAGSTGVRYVVRLRCVGIGHYLELTSEHRVRLAHGAYKRADDLVPGDRVLAASRDLRGRLMSATYEVLSVQDLSRIVDVYDLEVEGEHNFIANEICVHNSCSNPNLFNLKRPDECEECKGKAVVDGVPCRECNGTGMDQNAQRVRNCFVAPDGWEFLDCDLSQIELRGMAALSRDPVLTQAFVEGRDVHEYAAMVATKGSGTHVTRQQAKPVNFGLCLAPGTMVVTAGGTKRIEDVVVGDSVWTHRRRWRPVTGTYTRAADHLIRITTRTGKVVESTDNHMWYSVFPSVNGRNRFGWVRADELQVSDFLVEAVGYAPKEQWQAEECIVSIERILYEGVVHDITVEEDHSFSAGRLVTHNSYGLSDIALSKRLRCSIELARKIMAAVIGAYTGVSGMKSQILAYAQSHGYTYTVWFKRDPLTGMWKTVRAGKRPLPDLGSQDGKRRSNAVNAAFATIIQGTFSGFLVQVAHARLVQWILDEGLEDDVHLVLTVYDSLVTMQRKHLTRWVAQTAGKYMTDFVIGYLSDGKTPFPLVADYKVGSALGSMKKYKP